MTVDRNEVVVDLVFAAIKRLNSYLLHEDKNFLKMNLVLAPWLILKKWLDSRFLLEL